jgi:SAM-dependent methyltransferase
MVEGCNPYSYFMDSPLSLVSIRQMLKLWHAMALVERCKTTYPRILDVGCGHGELGKMLKANNVGCEYWAVDLAQKFKIDAVPAGSRFRQMDLTKQSITDLDYNRFDLVFMYDFMQNINPVSGDKVLREVSDIIVPHGCLSISTRNSLMPADSDRVDEHMYRPDIEGLMELLESEFQLNEPYGINYGQGVDDLPELEYDSSPIQKLLPARMYRLFAGVTNWEKCKWVMIDGFRRA